MTTLQNAKTENVFCTNSIGLGTNKADKTLCPLNYNQTSKTGSEMNENVQPKAASHFARF